MSGLEVVPLSFVSSFRLSYRQLRNGKEAAVVHKNEFAIARLAWPAVALFNIEWISIKCYEKTAPLNCQGVDRYVTYITSRYRQRRRKRELSSHRQNRTTCAIIELLDALSYYCYSLRDDLRRLGLTGASKGWPSGKSWKESIWTTTQHVHAHKLLFLYVTFIRRDDLFIIARGYARQ